MTRFARARGSKACNERKEEEPTPWHVLRQQLVDKTTDYNVTKHDILSSIKCEPNSNSKEEVWCDFDDLKRNGYNCLSKDKKKQKKDKEKHAHKEEKKINKIKAIRISESDNKNSHNALEKKSLVLKTKSSEEFHKSCKTKEKDLTKCEPEKSNTGVKKEKQQKIDSKKIKKPNNLNASKQNCVDTTTHEPKCNSIEKKSTHNPNLNLIKKPRNEQLNNYGKFYKTNLNKFSNQKTHNNAFTIIANGREIKVVNFEGFFIKKDDANELKKLRTKLRAQNIPKDKIKIIMKLERRKAEKALAREKNNVCFHCRKFGHNFSDCPDIKDAEMSKSGMCFKCGSMEHSHFQCKVIQSQDFRYAVCFICREQGHIARQCSLNPQGQYPKGGSCHECGEVTHLKKDCPKAVVEKSSNIFTVEHLKSSQLEDISEDISFKTKKSHKRKTEVVKF